MQLDPFEYVAAALPVERQPATDAAGAFTGREEPQPVQGLTFVLAGHPYSRRDSRDHGKAAEHPPIGPWRRGGGAAGLLGDGRGEAHNQQHDPDNARDAAHPWQNVSGGIIPPAQDALGAYAQGTSLCPGPVRRAQSDASSDAMSDALRALPSVDRIARELEGPHPLAVAAARRAIAERRLELERGEGPAQADLLARASEHLRALTHATLQPVYNATGVIIHTGLGRAPLAEVARTAVARVAGGYSNLEIGLDDGRRGSRQAHVRETLSALTGAESALVVNNGAAAVLLAVAASAGPGGAVIVSRGQLVEIGGGFRIPDVVAQAGADLIEVGTTNRTRRSDYERAIQDHADRAPLIILRVHQSNFRTVGFVASVGIEELARLGTPVVDDLGSGALAQGIEAVDDEPDVRRSIAAGVELACFSGDKLLGGPQAGILVGRKQTIERAERHPLARAMRIDKLSLAALEATLSLYRTPELARREIPVLAMLQATESELLARAEQIRASLGERGELVRSVARVGGGALPLLELEGPAVALHPDCGAPEELAARLRLAPVPVIGRISGGRLLLDPRTLTDAQAAEVAELVARALDG